MISSSTFLLFLGTVLGIILDFLHNSIRLKWLFLSSFLTNLSTLCKLRLSKFIKKFIGESLIFSIKASPARSLFLLLTNLSLIHAHHEHVNFEDPTALNLQITSDKTLIASVNETIFMSCLIKNSQACSIKAEMVIEGPIEWQVVPNNKMEVVIPALDAIVQIFALQVPSTAQAGDYELFISLGALSERVIVQILPDTQLKIHAETLLPYYELNEEINFNIVLWNCGNTSLNVRLEGRVDPFCSLHYWQEPLSIPPQTKYLVPIHLKPDLGPDEEKQFILFNIRDAVNQEILCSETWTFHFTPPVNEELTPYIYVPAYATLSALNEEGKNALIFEYGGSGVIDEQRERRVEYYFQLPVKNQQNFYNSDQTFYLDIAEPSWDVYLGDTVYSLSPLTQRYCYGRGAGIDIEQDKFYSGAHYTQNSNRCHDKFKEGACYLGFSLQDECYLTGNLIHRNGQVEPASTIFSISTECQFTKNLYMECEVGKNFAQGFGKKGSHGYRFNIQGQTDEKACYEVEGISAGTSFYGYYNDLSTFSGFVDLPLNSQMRATISLTHLKQSFHCRSSMPHTHFRNVEILNYVTNVYYRLSQNAAISFNGLLLKAQQKDRHSSYDFFQPWSGLTACYNQRCWNLTTTASWGYQKDYLRRPCNKFLQRYWVYTSRAFTPNLMGNLYYEVGNTNYFDAKAWSKSFGGSLSYRYQPYGLLEFLVQKTHQECRMNLFLLRLSHTFRNKHYLEISGQYCRHFKRHQDCLFYISYTVPFSQFLGRRKDIGHLYGCVKDIDEASPIKGAVLTIDGKEYVSDLNGNFLCKNLPAGMHDIKVKKLPKSLINEQYDDQKVYVAGGKDNQTFISVRHTCTVKGEVILYCFEKPIEEILISGQKENSLIKDRALHGIKIGIYREEEHEAYTTTSDFQGKFHFPELRPGTWKVRVFDDQLPENYYFKANEQLIEINRGDNPDLIFEAIPIPPTLLLLGC